MEVWWINRFSMSEITELHMKISIHIEELRDPAIIPMPIKSGLFLIALKSLLISSFLWELQLLNNLFQLPLRRITFPSNYTRAASIQETVERSWTMEFWQSGTEVRAESYIGKLKTLGDHLGVLRDTLWWKGIQKTEKENVVSKWLLLFPGLDSIWSIHLFWKQYL